MRVLLALIVCLPALAHARAQSDLPYKIAEAYSVAMRFVRVDKGCTITDKDPEAAFVTFECKEDEKIKRGAIEIFGIKKDGVRVQVQLGDDPHYVEIRWIELIERKLRDERGSPPAAKGKEPAAAPKPPDGGTSTAP
jgi:hypothetical protein